MEKRGVIQNFPGIEEGPQSRPEEDTGHEWLNRRMAAGDVDAAFSAEDRQRQLSQLGDTSWGRHSNLDITSKARGGADEQPLSMDEGQPVTHLYRGMSEDEFQQSKQRGFIQSDMRGVIDPSWEGTNAAATPATAHYYLPKGERNGGRGRIVKLSVLNQDQWFASPKSGYVHTRSQVPWDRVVSHTESIVGPDSPDAPPTIRQGVIERERREEET